MYQSYNHFEIATMSLNNNYSNISHSNLQGTGSFISNTTKDGLDSTNGTIIFNNQAHNPSNSPYQKTAKGILTQLDEETDADNSSESLKIAATYGNIQGKKRKSIATPTRLFSLNGNIYALDDSGFPSFAGFSTANEKPIMITPKGRSNLRTTSNLTQEKIIDQSNENDSTTTNKSIETNGTTEVDTRDSLTEEHDNTRIHPPKHTNISADPNRKQISLDPELEPLLPLILSQHEAFTPHFVELGKISLTLSKDIAKKKENFSLLKDNKKIPRSRRIKVELTKSPTFSTDTDFIQLKDKMKNIVSDFIQKGTECMIEWGSKNIQLLLKDRCHNIFTKALQILEVISSYHSETIGQPSWPSAKNSLTFFLIKVYFSGPYFKHHDLLNFLDLSKDEVILIVSKILT